MGQHVIAVLRHGVARSGDGLAEHDLADVEADMGIGVDRLGDAAAPGGEMPVALGAVAVELHMGEMQGRAFRRLDGRERGLDIAGNAQLVAVDMQRMGDAQLAHRAREGGHDAPRRHAVVGRRNVEAELAAVELEGADAAGVDHLHRHRMGGAHHPGDIVVDHRLLGAFGQEAQQEIVVAEHDIAALVDHRRVGELGMGVARIARHHRRLEGGGIAELGIAIAGEEGAGCVHGRCRCAARRHGRHSWPRWSSVIKARARLTLPPATWLWMSMPPGMTILPARSKL